MSTQTIASYSESNYDGSATLLGSGVSTAIGESFQNTYGITLNSAKFYLTNSGVGSGNVYAKVYAHSGTFGTSSVPTGAALATSDAVAATSIAAGPALVTFSFSGANRITLSPSTYYIVTVESTAGGSPYFFGVGDDSTSPTFPGNSCRYGGTWNAYAGTDCCFYIYGTATTATVVASAATAITKTTATINGEVTATGGTAVTGRGFDWGTSAGSLTNHVTAGSGTGIFSSNLSGLIANTTYYFRPYATNTDGTSYGTTESFLTSPDVPTVATNTVTNLSINDFVANGNVTSDMGASITERGFVVATHNNPTLLDDTFVVSGTTGEFSSLITGRDNSTIYYYRAYAENSVGLTYGNVQLAFTAGGPIKGSPYPMPVFKRK